MWLVTTQGFYSTVAHRMEPGMLLVRARVRKDLENLERQIPGVRGRIFRDDLADYPYRVVVTGAEWTKAVALLSMDVNYDNFKSAVAAVQGHKRAGVYHRVWNALTHLEPKFAKRYYGAPRSTFLDADWDRAWASLEVSAGDLREAPEERTTPELYREDPGLYHRFVERFGPDPEKWPAWTCGNCHQRNSGWSLECGRCERRRKRPRKSRRKGGRS